MTELLRVVGSVAGLAGIGFGALLLIYRDFVRQFLQRRAFRTLSATQATTLLIAVVVLTFAIAVAGVFAGLVPNAGPVTFLILIGLLLCFTVVVLVLIGPQREGRAAPAVVPRADDLERLIDRGALDAAEQDLGRLFSAGHDEPPVWYWRARIAAARDNLPVALAYADEALKREPHHVAASALKVRLLLLSPGRGDRTRAKRLAESLRGVDGRLDSWLDLVTASGLFRPGVTTAAEIDARCPLPAELRLPVPTAQDG
ncbi:type IV pilus biogenesis/stability protein PilW [Dactylosporangium siamense]|uniref:Tetratricopeptide repeat protein n=1 Tax=Dactylosporangium siamense TaxID=685454 RepID=A0A919PW53_9ACTN|nr:hypothetical protein [Dactylosporangium siamense]GIG50361.1 hypothetical protein Dsi01nite_084020 [Dactylosporangium siamense]